MVHLLVTRCKYLQNARYAQVENKQPGFETRTVQPVGSSSTDYVQCTTNSHKLKTEDTLL
jgi:hypothetical protein